jgi:hypothetical protein
MGHLHGERRQAGGDMACQREQRARADARRFPRGSGRRICRTGEIGDRPAKRPSSPARQLDDDIGRAAPRPDGNERQPLTAKRVMPVRHRDVRYKPINNGGILR